MKEERSREGHHSEKGEKGYEYENGGGFRKVQKTKGVHTVHKINEYKKKIDFFDEDFIENNYEKHGGSLVNARKNDGSQFYEIQRRFDKQQKEINGKKNENDEKLLRHQLILPSPSLSLSLSLSFLLFFSLSFSLLSPFCLLSLSLSVISPLTPSFFFFF